MQEVVEQTIMPPHSFSFFVAVCFTLNYIIGSGFLTLPWAFYETGWLLSLIILGIVTLVSVLASWFILEAMARAEILTNHQKSLSSSSLGGGESINDDDKVIGGGGGHHVGGVKVN